MGAYHNMLRDLIKQSELNRKLLNFTNQTLYVDEHPESKEDEQFRDACTSIEELRKRYLEEYERVYPQKGNDLQDGNDPPNGYDLQPPYKYFDGTEYINSLFSGIVVPMEFLGYYICKDGEQHESLTFYKEKLKKRYEKEHGGVIKVRTWDDVLKAADEKGYTKCQEIICGICDSGRLVSNYLSGVQTEEDRIKSGTASVYWFMKHLRDALCHSGNGNLHFVPYSDIAGPQAPKDITHFIFYDEKKVPAKDEDAFEHLCGERVLQLDLRDRRMCFCTKIELWELFALVRLFDNIILNLVAPEDNDNNRVYDLLEKVEKLTGKNLNAEWQ